jgi:hypothetical protein
MSGPPSRFKKLSKKMEMQKPSKRYQEEEENPKLLDAKEEE